MKINQPEGGLPNMFIDKTKNKELTESNFVKIIDFFKFNIYRKITSTCINIKEGVKNLIKWSPVIWNDRDFDYIFIFRILKFKLEQMEKRFRECDYTMDSQKNAREIKQCIKILNRIINQDYCNIAFMFHDKKWGNLFMELHDSEIEDDESHPLVLHREKVRNLNDQEEEKKEFRRCMDQENYLENQDIEYLFKIINKHIRKWWD